MEKAKKMLRAISCTFFVLLVLMFCIWPEYFIFAFFAVVSEFGSNSHDISWNILDDKCRGEKIDLNFWTPISSSREETAKRTVVIGKTKRIRLPQKMYFTLDYAENPEDFCVFVPHENCRQENKGTGEWKKSSHEIIVFAKPSVIENGECFRISSTMENSSCSLCYFDFELCQFVWIDSSDGVFFKKDKHIRHEMDLSHPYDDEICLYFFVKSLLYEDESYNMPVKYKRDAEILRG